MNSHLENLEKDGVVLRHLRLIFCSGQSPTRRTVAIGCQSPTLDTNYCLRSDLNSTLVFHSFLLPAWPVCRSTVAVLVCRPTHTVLYFRASKSCLVGLLGRPTSPTLLMAKKKLKNYVKKLPTKTEKAADQNRKIAGCFAGSRLQMTTVVIH